MTEERSKVGLWAGVLVFVAILVALALAGVLDSCQAAPLFDGKAPVHDGQPGESVLIKSTDPLLTWKRVYPFARMRYRLSIADGLSLREDALFGVGTSYSLGAFAPQFLWEWDPNDGRPDVHEVSAGVSVNLRAIF